MANFITSLYFFQTRFGFVWMDMWIHKIWQWSAENPLHDVEFCVQCTLSMRTPGPVFMQKELILKDMLLFRQHSHFQATLWTFLSGFCSCPYTKHSIQTLNRVSSGSVMTCGLWWSHSANTTTRCNFSLCGYLIYVSKNLTWCIENVSEHIRNIFSTSCNVGVETSLYIVTMTAADWAGKTALDTAQPTNVRVHVNTIIWNLSIPITQPAN